MLPNLAQGFLESGTCFDLPLSRKQGRLAIFLDRREVAVLVRWGAFVVGGGIAAMVLVVVMVGVVGGEEVGITEAHRGPSPWGLCSITQLQLAILMFLSYQWTSGKTFDCSIEQWFFHLHLDNI